MTQGSDPQKPALPPRRPYLLRAMHQWMSDAALTPHIIVDTTVAGAEVPQAYVKDGKIVLNVSYNATQRLNISNDWVTFDARFAGVINHVRFPVRAVLGIYARETGEGMAFSGDDPAPPTPPDQTGPGSGEEAARRPQLKIVK
jgi:stringent starvation protein B